MKPQDSIKLYCCKTVIIGLLFVSCSILLTVHSGNMWMMPFLAIFQQFQAFHPSLLWLWFCLMVTGYHFFCSLFCIYTAQQLCYPPLSWVLLDFTHANGWQKDLTCVWGNDHTSSYYSVITKKKKQLNTLKKTRTWPINRSRDHQVFVCNPCHFLLPSHFACLENSDESKEA